ncbi:MAG: hypothetical protein ABL949_07830 [Fimbriimonadaceae bacterium]
MRRIAVQLFLIPSLSIACLWDSDTLSQELSGKLDVGDAITGRIARYPDAYYKRRIEIAKTKIAANPFDMESYDNIAVAFDRLGNDDEALQWIAAKRRATHSMTKEESYRTLANEGTFWAHKFFASGAKRDHLEWLKRGRDLIAEAINLNPQSHFGRERAQLGLMNWTIQRSKGSTEGYLHFAIGSDFVEDGNFPPELQKGLVGLVALGNAWESVDVIHAIGSLSFRDANIAELANFRVKELEAEGRRSLTGQKLEVTVMFALYDNQKRIIADNFSTMRRSAEEYKSNLDQFVLEQLKAGKHPDLDGEAFWAGYVETPRPELKELLWIETQSGVVTVWVVFMISGCAFALGLIGWILSRLMKTVVRANTYKYCKYAKVRAVKGDYEGAKADLSHVILRYPKDAMPYFRRAECSFKLGEYDLCVADCEVAIKLNPSLDDACTLLDRARNLSNPPL